MEYKFLYLDLTICAVWMLFALGRYGCCSSLFAAIVMHSVFYRFVLTFSLSNNVNPSWLPLLISAPLSAWTVLWGRNFCIDQIADYFFHLTHNVKDVVHDPISSYRIFVRLVTDSVQHSESLIKIADNVAALDELK